MKKAEKKADGEAALLEKIAAMEEPFRGMGERVHALIQRSAPGLAARTWYGMPAYAKDGQTVCFFRADKKYMTFGITQEANPEVEAGAAHQLIASAWYFSRIDEATEAELTAIVGRAAR